VGETFTVYRGVAGLGRQCRVSGFSWTLDLPRACWFAVRLSPAAATLKGDVPHECRAAVLISAAAQPRPP
jgi:hypothetical protein